MTPDPLMVEMKKSKTRNWVLMDALAGSVGKQLSVAQNIPTLSNDWHWKGMIWVTEKLNYTLHTLLKERKLWNPVIGFLVE